MSANEIIVKAITTDLGYNCSSEKMNICCRRVIVAISPRLAITSINFSPPLPPEKYELQRAMIPGQCIKVIVVYSSSFWLDKGVICGNNFLCDSFPMHNMFHSLVGPYPAIIGLITASAVIEYGKLTAETRKYRVLNQIDVLFNADHSSSEVYHPLQYIEKNWCTEEFSGGCFACSFSPSTFKTFGPHLRTPIEAVSSSNNQKPVLFWASTETSMHFNGYMEGAMASGQSVAEQLIESFEN